MTELAITPEVVEQIPNARRNLMTVLVLSITLVKQVLGDAKIGTKMTPEESKKVLEAIQEAVSEAFPEVAPTILGLFGIELMGLQPLLKDPQIIIEQMMKDYAFLINNDASQGN